MSRPLSFDDVLFRQRFLSCCGFYTDTLDGLWGPNTDAAEAAFAAKSAAIAAAEGTFDARSERHIQSLQSVAQTGARRSLKAIRAAGTDARIISGTRTYPEQDSLFRQGRFGNPGPIVTRARGGQSWHNFGLAWDIGIFDPGGRYREDDGPYVAAAPRGKVPGVTWGGDWTGSFQDNPHYQFIPAGQTVSQARAIFEAGGRS
jgi:peptidoglycan L-alanyl-D-glutamate endopeptidase CwlK